MGCSHSKANDVVVEPITAPPSECGKASMDMAFTEIIVEEASASAPPPPLEEEEELEVEVEAPAEPTEPIVVEEEPVAVDEQVEEPVQVEVPAQSETAFEEELDSSSSEEEDHQEDDEFPVEPEVEAADEVELQQQQEKSAVVEKSAATVTTAAWTFAAEKVAFSIGVAFFHIAGANAEGESVHLAKRYSDFKVLHAAMAKLMDRDELPAMPGTSFLQGRNDKALLQERETAFVKMLNAIAVHPEAAQSAAFAAFLV
ncbi:Aspartyl/asparaginyl beta-hydroxylase [Phytophthora cinnamomi]|uniref:Aspartyl/asparaginyl beta-hydroxylase n=1 Tax=Phytophthora cinnamomi TaxID=4785 RepID=UPI0035597FA2|nr:Aspartyl/asparaginyl beta-hydroxylase [Phytophthora cinnamomi]